RWRLASRAATADELALSDELEQCCRIHVDSPIAAAAAWGFNDHRKNDSANRQRTRTRTNAHTQRFKAAEIRMPTSRGQCWGLSARKIWRQHKVIGSF